MRQIVDRLRRARSWRRRIEGSIRTAEDAVFLRDIYFSGNSTSRDELEPVLRSQRTDYHWIAQQVKKGYLAVHALPWRTQTIRRHSQGRPRASFGSRKMSGSAGNRCDDKAI